VIAIVDYGSGNVAAIANVFKRLKVPHLVTADHDALRAAERFILPGVGAFDTTMCHFNESGLVAVLNEQILGLRKKVLGICVGMQILADSSEEGSMPGLGWISGRVRKIDASLLARKPKLPHMGWNSIDLTGAARVFDGVDLTRGFYFLHNYYFDAADSSMVHAVVDYGKKMPCAVGRENVFGVQFHPEKSDANGVAVFRNLARL